MAKVVKTHPHPILTEHDAFADLLTSVDIYADVGVWNSIFALTKHFHFIATTNDLLVQILGSLDGGLTYPIVVEAEFAVDPGTPVSKTITVYYSHLKVQVKPAVAATHGTLATQFAGASF